MDRSTSTGGGGMWIRIGLILMAMLVAPGCGVFSPGDGGDGSESPTRKTPEGVVGKLTDAYRRKDLDDYLDCLADSFVFYFVPKDSLDPIIPPQLYWGRTDEEEAHRNMFEQADLITLTLTGDGKLRVSLDPERWMMERFYDLRITAESTVTALGRAQFYAEQQEDGLYSLYRWDDLEEVGR
jgi:hypothetical protein